MDNSRNRPVVFVSSTCYDLKQIRADMKEFIEGTYGFDAMLSEFDSFPIDPCVGTFENCLSNVDQCADVFCFNRWRPLWVCTGKWKIYYQLGIPPC